MIRVGVTGWAEHEALYAGGVAQKDRLRVYGRHFPIVEVDSAYYAILRPETYARWAAEVPADFGFIVKAYSRLTGHDRSSETVAERAELFRSYLASVEPLRRAGKLVALLFQYPPWFDCTRENVNVLRATKELLGDMPAALEFRHRSWFTPDMADKTLAFMEREGWIHAVCDEPQAGEGSIPIVPQATHPELTIVRFHGRNAAGWVDKGPNRRQVRCLYRYSEAELSEWAERLAELQRQSRHVCLLFNNNSGGDAVPNARQMMALLGLSYAGEAPGQLELFEL
ncbi:hypothetical protein SD70_22195 [Gordoniibacillus kamchatkensis]|uniref:DUF72 domain-containing protein n=1 Tax=Gordoniibacillus kamchatkensis TaxID=1590651 RepID=A0ABR5ADX3_9BACL|nr:DUF72 domain-containing protein [Paenibacillus sp. VKM B-2647]KIL39140.1 hypothetical protein SD70_22195 [Paenibacillus sp. VKM B-2647]